MAKEKRQEAQEASERTIRRDETIVASDRHCGMPPKGPDGTFGTGYSPYKCPFLEPLQRRQGWKPGMRLEERSLLTLIVVGFRCRLAGRNDDQSGQLEMDSDRALRGSTCLEGEHIGRADLGRRVIAGRAGQDSDRMDILRDALERIGIGKGPARAAFLRLLAYKFPHGWPDGLKVPYAEKGDERAPFFTEAYLYNLLGKDEARTLLGLLRRVGEALRLDRRELP